MLLLGEFIPKFTQLSFVGWFVTIHLLLITFQSSSMSSGLELGLAMALGHDLMVLHLPLDGPDTVAWSIVLLEIPFLRVREHLRAERSKFLSCIEWSRNLPHSSLAEAPGL